MVAGRCRAIFARTALLPSVFVSSSSIVGLVQTVGLHDAGRKLSGRARRAEKSHGKSETVASYHSWKWRPLGSLTGTESFKNTTLIDQSRTRWRRVLQAAPLVTALVHINPTPSTKPVVPFPPLPSFNPGDSDHCSTLLSRGHSTP